MTDPVDDALAKLPRVDAPASLHARIRASAPSTRKRRDRIVTACISFAAGVALCFVLVHVHHTRELIVEDVVNDHVRTLAREKPFDIESGGIHQVKPWFQGKIDFAPSIKYAGDDDFPLVGGAVAYVVDRRAAQFGFMRRLHKITLLVFPATDLGWPAGETPDVVDVNGYHAVGWRSGPLDFALVSDVDASELLELAKRIRTAG